ncbi:ATP-binding cassette domain-containing protein [Plastoroseomonas arctica]|uniref:ATP-binding cassette domain-containing protein n=1 Tax=Plastoroseomonas arctica TaxID=1509237 RepID=A0AAF1JX16_9PROT|nr:ATP-binding cassette domain-containing protein [Plastoroseomonas arctica]MBR0655744.1 ATP-binding cassette domain-containing protein [Plastoroseomonas arctica]
MHAPILVIESLRHAGPTGATLFDGLDLTIARGEWVTLLGGVGAGKTTLLRLIAEQGWSKVSARLVAPPRPSLPWQGCAQRLAQPLRSGGLPRAEAEMRVRQALARVGLAEQADTLPSALSEGASARLALAAAMLSGAGLLLLDGLADAGLAAALLEWRRESGVAVLCAVRDAMPAAGLGDRVAVLAGGRIVQQGLAQALFDTPADARVARLMGPCTLLPGRLLDGEDEDGFATMVLDGGTRLLGRAPAVQVGERCLAYVRPGRVVVASGAAGDFGEGALPARVLERRALGDVVALRLALADGTDLLAHRPAGGAALPAPGAQAVVLLPPQDVVILPEAGLVGRAPRAT